MLCCLPARSVKTRLRNRRWPGNSKWLMISLRMQCGLSRAGYDQARRLCWEVSSDRKVKQQGISLTPTASLLGTGCSFIGRQRWITPYPSLRVQRLFCEGRDSVLSTYRDCNVREQIENGIRPIRPQRLCKIAQLHSFTPKFKINFPCARLSSHVQYHSKHFG